MNRGARSAQWQHFLPAGYLAGFGYDSASRRRRETLLWVARRGGKVFRQTAENVGASTAIYTLERPGSFARNTDTSVRDPPYPFVVNEDPLVIDSMWSSVETRLPSAIAAFSRFSDFVDAETWANVLVPFVAHLFARGPDFEKRFELRRRFHFGDKDPFPQTKDNLNMARLIETTRLMGVIMRAEWIVIRPPNGARFITNDVGRATIRHADDPNRIWFFVPLRHDLGLCISKGAPTHQLYATTRGGWVVGPFGRPELDEEHVANFNRALSRFSTAEIYGQPEVLVRAFHAEMGERQNVQLLEPNLISVTGEARAHEELHAQFVKHISEPPSPERPFVPKMNLIDPSEHVSMKMYQFAIPGKAHEALSLPMQYRRLDVDGPIAPDGGPLIGDAQVAEVMALAQAAMAEGGRFEDLVFYRHQDGKMRRYVPEERLGFLNERLAQLKRPTCCVVIAGLDIEQKRFHFGLVQFVPVAGPYPIGDPRI